MILICSTSEKTRALTPVGYILSGNPRYSHKVQLARRPFASASVRPGTSLRPALRF